MNTFLIELGFYHNRLNYKIDLYMTEYTEDMLLPDREKIISCIEALKENLTAYFASPILVKKDALYKTLSDVKEEIQNRSPYQIISELISSINTLLNYIKSIKQKRPMPPPRKRTLPSVAFFKPKHQKLSVAYHQSVKDSQLINSSLCLN